VPQLKTENPNILDQFVEEMPAFLSFLGNRKLATENRNRMWFHPNLLKTEALKKVIQHSMPTIQKELIQFLKDMFLDFGVDEILMTRKAIHKECFNNKYEANYLEKVLKENLKVDQYHILDETEKYLFDQPKKIYKVHRHSYPKWEIRNADGKTEFVRVDVQDNGRPYVFKREQFVGEEVADAGEENRHINEMTPQIGIDFSKVNRQAEQKPDDLPF